MFPFYRFPLNFHMRAYANWMLPIFEMLFWRKEFSQTLDLNSNHLVKRLLMIEIDSNSITHTEIARTAKTAKKAYWSRN